MDASRCEPAQPTGSIRTCSPPASWTGSAPAGPILSTGSPSTARPVRRSHDRAKGRAALHRVSAFAANSHLVLGQEGSTTRPTKRPRSLGCSKNSPPAAAWKAWSPSTPSPARLPSPNPSATPEPTICSPSKAKSAVPAGRYRRAVEARLWHVALPDQNRHLGKVGFKALGRHAAGPFVNRKFAERLRAATRSSARKSPRATGAAGRSRSGVWPPISSRASSAAMRPRRSDITRGRG